MRVSIQLGLAGKTNKYNALQTALPGIEASSLEFGSFHILNMTDHYLDYVHTPHTMLFTSGGHIVLNKDWSIQKLNGKTSSADVSGNIGEIIGATAIKSLLNLAAGDITHIKQVTKVQCPDFLLKVTDLTQTPLWKFINHRISSTDASMLKFAAMEAKARRVKSTENLNAALADGFMQVAKFWTELPLSLENQRGFGFVCRLKILRQFEDIDPHDQSSELTVNVFLPKGDASKKMTAPPESTCKEYWEALEKRTKQKISKVRVRKSKKPSTAWADDFLGQLL